MAAVEAHGHEWVKIGELMQRTSENVWDKWRELGGKNSKSWKKGEWRLEEKIALINLIDQSLISKGEEGFLKWEIKVNLKKFATLDSLPEK